MQSQLHIDRHDLAILAAKYLRAALDPAAETLAVSMPENKVVFNLRELAVKGTVSIEGLNMDIQNTEIKDGGLAITFAIALPV